jgi:hypothetical protein
MLSLRSADARKNSVSCSNGSGRVVPNEIRFSSSSSTREASTSASIPVVIGSRRNA